ncbi:MAG TPA: hypothetical protein VHP33_33730 [Polyangiaceae bacterium]|nr:hypothetical protein [Polyangiaceae bacterium]
MSPRRFRVWLSLAAVLVGVGACEINPQPPLPAGSKGPNAPGAGGTQMDGATAGSSSGGSLVIETGGTSGTGAATGGAASTAGSAPVDVPGHGGAGGESSAGGAGGDAQDGGAGGQDGSGTPPK